MKLTKHQIVSKDRVVNLIQEEFVNNSNEPIWFTAPTGAGKTFIAAKAIEEIVVYDQSQTVVLFFTLSQAKLPLQIQNNFYNYHVRFKYEYIESPSSQSQSETDLNLVAHTNFVYIFGISSLRKDTILFRENNFDLFIENLKAKNQRILVVWDEAHIGAKLNSKFHQQVIAVIKQQFARRCVLLKITATIPKVKNVSPSRLIKMTYEQAVDDELIKSGVQTILDVKQKWNYQQIIDAGLKQFKKVKTEYHKHQTINPAVLIQIGAVKSERQAEWNQNLKILQEKVENLGLTWCLWTNKEKKLSSNVRKIKPSPDYLARSDCEIDVIIFIYALATGWDIPRACMLLQLTELQSKQLTNQTIGRVRRNPTRPLYSIKNTIYDQYWLYTNLKADQKWVLILKPTYKDTEFLTLRINLQSLERKKRKLQFHRIKHVQAYLSKNATSICQRVKSYFQTLDYHSAKREISFWKEKYRVRMIVNLIQLEQMWRERYPDSKFRETIKAWTMQNQSAQLKISYQFQSALTITNWEWYLFWLNKGQDYLQRAKRIWNSKYEVVQNLQISDWDVPRKQFMCDSILQIDKGVTRSPLLITNEYESFFPYDEEQNTTRVLMDSETEKRRLEEWFRSLKALAVTNQIKVLTMACKNFLQLRIAYQLWETATERTSNQHPDLIVRLKKGGQDYSLVVEIKSLQEGEFNINEQIYKDRIADINACYPKFAQKLSSERYIFILDLTEKAGNRKIKWYYANNMGKASDVKACLQQILKKSSIA